MADKCIVHAIRHIVQDAQTIRDIDASIEAFMFRSLPALSDTDLPGELTGLLGAFDAIMLSRDCIAHMGLIHQYVVSEYNRTIWFHMFRGMLFTRPVCVYRQDCSYDATESKRSTYLMFMAQLDNINEDSVAYADRVLEDIACQRGDFLIF